ncbi:hypothetical protein E1B28_004981 [Marasmius oreades]|uniref:Uncharacterized protein n=2 Tax=Marasmius oreades TaxID=181124 RepID=A0A9P8ADI8_9AGAR|nr:uncharacterized protein E1B28_004981 [Marasmius oreades]KAG7097649.1 hypothetical protein E1B28_004981 [Marasmius oreades]
MQLFGINRSSVPLLIFYGELLPLAHFWDRLGYLRRSYACTLARNMDWRESEMWIDPEQGTLIHGVEGPAHNLFQLSIPTVKTLPSSVQLLLQDDVCIRYLSRLPLVEEFDGEVIDVLHVVSMVKGEKSPTINRPHVLSTKTNSIIAVGSGVWDGYGCFDDRVLMPDGRTRFTLVTDHASSLNVYSGDPSSNQNAWLSQASRFFHRLGIPLDEDLSSYKLIVPYINLSGSIEDSEQRCSEDTPIYFFLHPPPFTPLLKDGSVTASIHTWSFDEDGKTSISRRHCKYLGLPTELRVNFCWESWTYHWPSETYRSIHKWQIARGFDPTTSDFARYLGYPAWDVLPFQGLFVVELLFAFLFFSFWWSIMCTLSRVVRPL